MSCAKPLKLHSAHELLREAAAVDRHVALVRDVNLERVQVEDQRGRQVELRRAHGVPCSIAPGPASQVLLTPVIRSSSVGVSFLARCARGLAR